MAERHLIRNSTAEFLIFQIEGKEQGVEVYYKDEDLWATQKAISTLFDCDRSVITKHLGNIFVSVELKEERVCAKFAHTAGDGKTYDTKFYSLDAIIAVGYRVNSRRAKKHIPMTMEDWAKRIDAYLSSDERSLLDNAGSVSHDDAVQHAETEFEKYRITQDRLFQSDFDKYLGALPLEEKCSEITE